MTSRKLVSRWRPPGFSGGSKSLISFHCLFVRSVGYLFLRIQCPYRLDGQVVKLSCSKQVQRFCSQLLIRNFSNSFLEKAGQWCLLTGFSIFWGPFRLPGSAASLPCDLSPRVGGIITASLPLPTPRRS